MSAPTPGPLAPGATVGIVGGGQLARMLAMAAARLGYRVAILDPDADCPAAQVANRVIAAPYADKLALRSLAEASSVVTYEFENVPVAPLREAVVGVPIRPQPDALEVSQDRVVEKAFLNGIGVETAEWRAVDSEEELDHALLDLRGDCILKTRRLGYDGKGQAVIRNGSPESGVFEALGSVPAILEAKVAFAYEMSVIAARSLHGATRAFDPAVNLHRLGILRRSTVPGGIAPEVAAQAQAIAVRILERLDYVGVIGVEFFARPDGRLLVNEIAPRVHNSGHWTEAACAVSQFEQHVRAVCGLPLGDTHRHSDAVMENLIGAEVETVSALLAEGDAVLHLYGKREVKAGRKMGHVTRISPRG